MAKNKPESESVATQEPEVAQESGRKKGYKRRTSEEQLRDARAEVRRLEFKTAMEGIEDPEVTEVADVLVRAESALEVVTSSQARDCLRDVVSTAREYLAKLGIQLPQ